MLTLAVDLPPVTHRAAANATLPLGCVGWANLGSFPASEIIHFKAENMPLTNRQ